jgi:membrane protein implicated in regulation of membrane protease activity
MRTTDDTLIRHAGCLLHALLIFGIVQAWRVDFAFGILALLAWLIGFMSLPDAILELIFGAERVHAGSDPLASGDGPRDTQLVGSVAEAVTDLRPEGTIQAGSRRRRATASYTHFVVKGSHVRVVGVRGEQLVVEPVIEEDTPPHENRRE